MREELSWSRGLMLICQKCGKTFDQPTAGEEMKMQLKQKLKASGQGAELRVITSGCLDVCKIGEQAVAICPVNGETQVHSFLGTTAAEEIEALALAFLKK